MTIPKHLLAVLAFILLLSACGNGTNENNFETIASEKTLPTNFLETAFKRETTPLFEYMVKKADNKSGFEHLWSLYGLKDKLPNIDFNKHNVFFLGVQESGSCPYYINKGDIRIENNTMKVSLSQPEKACTSDATPRTFVIRIDQKISGNIKNVVMVQSGAKTNVPFEN
ncbi:hypothetical protein [Pontibacillus yanchengensis]|uniref:Lipoprotein n=1 Tax=Pontibacillus yanchengensis Y32 TaxID=1385514 RepID=A0A0A2TFT1_9BACI|nr:hypothetical protein [Pontibacillus yanchengensis]KGP74389.1 hypothetical protein N782_15025 [Pontibacillus yanchengensis Y32]